MSPSWWSLLIAVAVALGGGVLWRSGEGKIRRPTVDREDEVFDQLPARLRQRLADQSDARVTLLQFSTAFCAPCRHTRILLTSFAESTSGVRHVEVDLTEHPEWSTPLGIHRTPTTLVFDDSGRELFRIGGVPRRQELGAALATHLP